MTEKKAKCLLIGTVVMWDNNPDELGTIRKLNQIGFYVDWENGKCGWIDYKDAAKVSIR